MHVQKSSKGYRQKPGEKNEGYLSARNLTTRKVNERDSSTCVAETVLRNAISRSAEDLKRRACWPGVFGREFVLTLKHTSRRH